jgi:hypothetical protein
MATRASIPTSNLGARKHTHTQPAISTRTADPSLPRAIPSTRTQRHVEVCAEDLCGRAPVPPSPVCHWAAGAVPPVHRRGHDLPVRQRGHASVSPAVRVQPAGTRHALPQPPQPHGHAGVWWGRGVWGVGERGRSGREVRQPAPAGATQPPPPASSPSPARQILAQVDFMAKYKDRHTWAMLPNLDEFVVLKKVRVALAGCKSPPPPPTLPHRPVHTPAYMYE